ncbi:DUF4276 family protein [Denitratisoma oestradiolicum]|uniref:DUF4276 family protein n=1 Tax=Denitratisoma oestradiolicum TaxID=311182 RepID=A0A6S6XR54_9PROT|nr:DUF4276 family protein [Denitratisoma oestradiolicum]TWO79484.1 hypothetical protein CBW56_14505 [Denitratisoma oestradiolicum]CAB1368421.1 conserved protein of unknown function [Denitratisoma oestradiolicum]
MKELVFLLEEDSAKAMLESLLPRILNPEIKARLIPFEGKQDLEKQMTRRMRGYLNPEARFIVLRDQDNAPNCKAVKAKLAENCHHAGQGTKSLVRIACRELETFYLADLNAVEQGLLIDKLAKYQGTAKFRDPDGLGNPSKELATLTNGRYEKVSGSRAIGKYLDVANERSPSFKSLIRGIRRMESELLALPGHQLA